MILADNGSPWFISGVPDDRWDNDVLHELHQVHGSDLGGGRIVADGGSQLGTSDGQPVR
jgi:hypothetical protein